ncbi:hypothetical protein [Brucella anthropi]|uniref:hypothetical protein n=1 Tax=Brucella anthropi TaxID=529 RepID=UPI003D98E98C
MTTLPEEAVKAAARELCRFGTSFSTIEATTSWVDEKWPRFKEEATLALTAAIPFLPVQGTVKKLAWIRPPLSDTLSRCDTDFGTYRTWTHDEANGKWFWSVEGGWNEANGEAPNEEAAKAAAQADYDARILSALEPSVCKTCNGRGNIGGMYRVGDGDVDGWEKPCPDCEPSPQAQSSELSRRLEEFLKENEDCFFDCEIQTVKDAISALSALEPSAARELALEEATKFLLDRLDDFERAISGGDEDLERQYAGHVHPAKARLDRSLSSPDHADAGKVDGDRWLPIESAPKDGTSILAVCAGVHERTGIPFIPEVVEWTQYGWRNEMWGEQPNHGIYSPTHWRHLPSAPSEGAE